MGMQRRMKIAASAALLLIAGCAGAGQNLKPAKAANEVAGMEKAAKATDNRVEVIAQTKEWPGEARITEEVEAVRIRITNNSADPVQIRYGNMRLVSPDGDTYSAIPPLAVKGDVISRDASVINEPQFVYSGYMVAPYYVDTYPGLIMYDGPFTYDAGYYTMYDQSWTTENLPTAEMLAWALPEGVLQPGGFVDGYVYFERVPSDEDEVRLEAVLAAAQTQPAAGQEQGQARTSPSGTTGGTQTSSGEQIASVSIPFVVD